MRGCTPGTVRPLATGEVAWGGGRYGRPTAGRPPRNWRGSETTHDYTAPHTRPPARVDRGDVRDAYQALVVSPPLGLAGRLGRSRQFGAAAHAAWGLYGASRPPCSRRCPACNALVRPSWSDESGVRPRDRPFPGRPCGELFQRPAAGGRLDAMGRCEYCAGLSLGWSQSYGGGGQTERGFRGSGWAGGVSRPEWLAGGRPGTSGDAPGNCTLAGQ